MKANPSISWREVSEIPRVAPAEIQVWRVNLLASTGEISRLRNFLSAQEQRQAAQFHFVHDQRRFVIRRAVLRQLLSANLGLHPEEIQIASDRFQKPQIAAAQNPMQLRFNSSHSSDWALIALAQNCESGVDVEQHRHLPDRDELANNFFSEPEISELNRLPEPARTAGFFNCWTRKEAFVKAIGQGLAFPLDRFSVSLAPEQSAAIFEIAGDDSTAHKKWSVTSINSIAGFSAALVFSSGLSSLALLDWPFASSTDSHI
jgi:4'-phosphopantetheinyl transferase